MVKINIGTALNIAYTAAIRDFLTGNPEGSDPRRYLAPARGAMAETVTRYLRALP